MQLRAAKRRVAHLWNGVEISRVMPMLVSGCVKSRDRIFLLIRCAVGVIQDAKFKRREALADLGKAATSKK